MLLHGSLTQTANLPAADGRIQVAFEFEYSPFPDPAHDSACRSALGTGRCVVDADAGHYEIRRLDIRLDQFDTGFDGGIAAGAESHCSPAEPHDLQEVPAADATTAHLIPLGTSISQPTCGIASSHLVRGWSRR